MSPAVRPVLAPAGTEAGLRRSLVLAGGGMRVAYQAGAVRALHEAGLRFAHADGTSGGTINLAMLLSGQSPEEMAERWRTLDPRGFVSFLPAHRYLRSLRWPALGSARGVVERVFPHLGIDADRIRRSEGLCGTFNVCNFTAKTNEVIEHVDIDTDLLVAGISLPVLMPPVAHRGSLYTDAVWIRDANVAEAVRRGSEEVWLIWCIGNTPRYHGGLFHQYVHMIEMSANGSLFDDFDRVRESNAGTTRPVRLHVVKPEHPLPLDPDYLRGRIDADALMARGYQDACRYLDGYDGSGVPWDERATAMTDPAPGVNLRLDLAGTIIPGTGDGQNPDAPMRLRLWGPVQLDDVDCALSTWQPAAPFLGHVRIGDAAPIPCTSGEVALRPRERSGQRPALVLRARMRWRGEPCSLRAEGPIGAGGGALPVTVRPDAGPAGTVLATGRLELGAAQAWTALRSLHATSVASPQGRFQADLRFGRYLAGVLSGGQG